MDAIFCTVDDRFEEHESSFRVAESFNDECTVIKVRCGVKVFARTTVGMFRLLFFFSSDYPVLSQFDEAELIRVSYANEMSPSTQLCRAKSPPLLKSVPGSFFFLHPFVSKCRVRGRKIRPGEFREAGQIELVHVAFDSRQPDQPIAEKTFSSLFHGKRE